MKYLLFIISVLSLSDKVHHLDSVDRSSSITNAEVIGSWVRVGAGGPMAIRFTEAGVAEVDFGNDGSVDVSSKYQIIGSKIIFTDENGAMCPEPGEYLVLVTDYYISFDLISDNCGGRIKSTMGYWTKPEHKDLINELDLKIDADPSPKLLLTRGRIYLAIGDSRRAQADLDKYLEQIDSDARAYLNRAATKMPIDMKGVVEDCDHSIRLDPENKNAYFLRGLARYELGEKQKACEDFEKAIQLGFTVLRIAEEQKCEGYWEEQE